LVFLINVPIEVSEDYVEALSMWKCDLGIFARS